MFWFIVALVLGSVLLNLATGIVIEFMWEAREKFGAWLRSKLGTPATTPDTVWLLSVMFDAGESYPLNSGMLRETEVGCFSTLEEAKECVQKAAVVKLIWDDLDREVAEDTLFLLSELPGITSLSISCEEINYKYAGDVIAKAIKVFLAEEERRLNDPFGGFNPLHSDMD